MMLLQQHRSRVRSWLSAAAMVLAAGSAGAFVEPENHHPYEIPLTEVSRHAYNRSADDAAKQRAVTAFSAVNGGQWAVHSWNPHTSTPSSFYGTGVQVAGGLFTEEDAVAAARGVIEANHEVFRADMNDLRLEVVPHAAGKWAVHYQQTYNGIDVWGGRVRLIFTEQGRLFVAGSDVYQNIAVRSNPSIPAAVAEDIARRGVNFDPATDSLDGATTLLVLPVPVSATEVEHHLVWRVRVRTADPIGIWVTHVDAHDGQILWRFNDIHFLDYQGTTEADVQRPSYCEGQNPETMPYLRVQIAGVGNAYADGDGNWTVPYAGNDARDVTADLYSPYVDLNNVAGAEGTFNGVATPGVPLQIDFSDGNSQKDEKDVYRAVNDIHDFFETFAPGFAYSNTRIQANVSRPMTCNAYWDGTINFYAEGGGCGNTGEIMGVVHHEFGHGVQNALIGGQGNEGLGEGNSDVLANHMTMESIIGRGFYLNNCSGGIRNSLNSLQYPENLNGSVHHDGQIIAGFHWDALQLLIQVYGVDQARLISATNWHVGRLLHRPRFQDDQVLATFMADDDNGDLGDGTPNYDIYCTAARNHDTDGDGFICPEILVGVVINHTPLATRTTEGDAQVVAEIYSTSSTLVEDSLRVRYSVNGGPFTWTPMSPTGQPDEFVGTIPNLTKPSEVEYYIRGRDEAGNTRNNPSLAPQVVHAFDVATVYDNIEAPSGWSVNLEGGDNATTGVWERVDPNGTSAQPEDDHTPAPGTICWITGNAPPGSGDGTNDVDGGATTLYSPVYDLTGAGEAAVKFFRWYSNDLGGSPNADTWVVQVRNNGGTWTDVERTMASSNAWDKVDFDLYALYGANLGNVQFKFVASDLGDGSLVEAGIDDFEILASFGPSDVTLDVGNTARFSLTGSRPNPTSQGSNINFEVPVASAVRLSIFDVSGRLVRMLADRSFEAGSHQVSWDGTDAQGNLAPSGVYFYKMQAGSFTATRSLVVRR